MQDGQSPAPVRTPTYRCLDEQKNACLTNNKLPIQTFYFLEAQPIKKENIN